MHETLIEILAFIGLFVIILGIVSINFDDWTRSHKKRCIKCGHMADKWYYDYCPYCGTKLE